MLYMVIEEFNDGPVPVYWRFRDRDRMTPHGLHYVNSWSLPTCVAAISSWRRMIQRC